MWALAVAPRLALAFVVMGSASAHAFGSEVLGCSIDGATWTAGSCAGSGAGAGSTSIIDFAPHNLSGTYSYAWTVAGGTIRSCSAFVLPCILRGCTATSSICDVQVAGSSSRERTFSASVQLTRSGLSRTLSATATIYADV